VARIMPIVSGTAQTRPHSRDLEARCERLIRLKSPWAQRERAGTFVESLCTEVTQSTTATRAPTAPYVTTDAKETLVTNYKSVIEWSVTAP
jgi:hypothetical protein